MRFRAFIDGAARGNPGPAGAGVYVEAERDRPVLEFYEPLGRTTNNVAEYRALLLALERAEEAGADEVEIRSDSRLLVEQMRGNFKIRAEHLKPEQFRGARRRHGGRVGELLIANQLRASRRVVRRHDLHARQRLQEPLALRERLWV